MKLWVISDSHGFHRYLDVPEVDMAIFCGDESNSFDPAKNCYEAKDFLDWYNELKIPYKIFVPGNHSTSIFRGYIRKEEYMNIIWFFNETKIINGLKIFGSPYTPRYGEWSYMYNRKDAYKYWDCIEEGTSITINHGPPQGILDLAEDENDRSRIVQVGCKTLFSKIKEIKPQLSCFGHIHSCRKKGIYNNGVYYNGSTTFVNASCLDHGDNSLSNGYIFEYINGKFSLLV
jgi:Icc-related predicted phosphoesterase